MCKRTENVTSNNVASVCTGLRVCRVIKLANPNLIINMPDMITVWLKDVFLQVSKGSLLRVAVSGQHETVKELLKSGDDVDLSDEVLAFFRLC